MASNAHLYGGADRTPREADMAAVFGKEDFELLSDGDFRKLYAGTPRTGRTGETPRQLVAAAAAASRPARRAPSSSMPPPPSPADAVGKAFHRRVW